MPRFPLGPLQTPGVISFHQCTTHISLKQDKFSIFLSTLSVQKRTAHPGCPLLLILVFSSHHTWRRTWRLSNWWTAWVHRAMW